MALPAAPVPPALESKKTLAKKAAAALQARYNDCFLFFSVLYVYTETFHIHVSTVLSMVVQD